MNPHTVAMVAPNSGVYVYDDATQRRTSVPGVVAGGPDLSWVQWGNDDSALLGTDSYHGILQPMDVTSAGVTSLQWRSRTLESIYVLYVPQKGLLYSYGGASIR